MEISLIGMKRGIVTGLHRYHVVTFVIVVLGSLGGVVLSLNAIVDKSGQTNTITSQDNGAAFDTKTIYRLTQLKTRDETPTPLDLSQGRTNPFVE